MDWRSTVKQGICSLATLLRVDSRLRSRMQADGLTAIVNLHRVSPHPNPFWSPLAPDLFDELLTYIGRHFHVTTLGELDLAHDRPSLVLSFDDGYKDFIEYAMPILAKHRMPANQNIIPACVETGRPPWNVALYDFLAQAPTSLLQDLHVPGFPMSAPGHDVASKASYGLALSRHLKNRPRSERQTIWEPIQATMDRFDTAHTPILTLPEIRQLQTHCEIGAHSYSHESMGFEDMPFFEADTQACKTYFTTHLGSPMDIYAFPNGSHRPEQVAYLREHGIKHILLVGERLASSDMPALPRLTVYGESLNELALRTTGWFAAREGA